MFILSIYNSKDSSPLQNILLFKIQYSRRFHPGKHIAIIHLHYLFWVCILGILTLLENNYFCPKIRIVFVLFFFFRVAMTAHLYFIYPFVFDMCSSVHLLRFSFVLQILSCAQLIPSWMKSRSRIHKRRKKIKQKVTKTNTYKNADSEFLVSRDKHHHLIGAQARQNVVLWIIIINKIRFNTSCIYIFFFLLVYIIFYFERKVIIYTICHISFRFVFGMRHIQSGRKSVMIESRMK